MRHSDQKGQSIIEMALVLPVLLLMFLGAWTAAALIGNQDSVAQATGAGARVAASLGDDEYVAAATSYSGCQQSATDACAVDAAVLAAMTPALSQLSNSTVTRIDIYEPGSCLPNSGGVLPSSCPTTDGALQSGNPLDDEYLKCGSTWTLVDGVGRTGAAGTCPSSGKEGTAPYTLADRVEVAPDEQAIAVQVTFKFTAPGLTFFTQTDTKYTAISLPPEAD